MAEHDFPRQKTEIVSTLRQQLEEDFEQSIDLTEESVFTTIVEVLSTVLAENQEKSLQEVYESAFIDTATGVDLDRVVALAGIQRRGAVHATGVQRFRASSPVNQDYVIPRGTTIRTGGENPTTFQTTEQKTLKSYATFDEQSPLAKFGGDVSGFEVTAGGAYSGNGSLRPTGSGLNHIFLQNAEVEQGVEMHAYMRAGDGGQPSITFGVQNREEFYDFTMDTSINQATVNYRRSGSDSGTIASDDVNWNLGNYYHVVINWKITNEIEFKVFQINGDGTESQIATGNGTDDKWDRGSVGVEMAASSDGGNRVDSFSEQAIAANVRAVAGGVEGNVGPNTVVNLPSPISGVSATTNPYAIGDDSYFDTDGIRFIAGNTEETDEQLRERARQSVSKGGDATADAILSSILNNVDGVSSVTVFENKTGADNTGNGGLPPYSFEAVVYGGDPQLIAEEIYDTKAVTANDYGGVNGTEVSQTVVSNVNGQEFEIRFSRPSKVDFVVEAPIITNENYVGDDAIRDQIVEYVGGTRSDGSTVSGLDTGEDIVINRIRNIITSEDNGVIGFDYSQDRNLAVSPSVTIKDGLEVIDIGPNEVAQTSASDGMITFANRQR